MHFEMGIVGYRTSKNNIFKKVLERFVLLN